MMHRMLVSLAVILAAGNLFGQTEAQGPNQTQKPKPEGNCSVSGRVISAAVHGLFYKGNCQEIDRKERVAF